MMIRWVVVRRPAGDASGGSRKGASSLSASPCPAPWMQAMPPHESWEPHSRPIHKLILTLDVVAIAVNRFRQLSFRPEEENLVCRSGEEWAEIKSRVFAEPGIPRLVDECIAESHSWSGDRVKVIEDAAQWIADYTLDWPERWHPRALNDVEHEKLFAAQGEHPFQAREHRARLLRLLALHGENIPLSVERREKLAFDCSVSQEALLAFLGEADPPPTMPPAAGAAGGSNVGKNQRGRNRTNPKQDIRIWDGWKNDHYADFAALARAFGIPKSEVEAAMERERKRRKKSEPENGVKPA